MKFTRQERDLAGYQSLVLYPLSTNQIGTYNITVLELRDYTPVFETQYQIWRLSSQPNKPVPHLY